MYVHRVPVTLMDVERSDGCVVRVRKLFSLLKSAGQGGLDLLDVQTSSKFCSFTLF